MTDLDLGLGLDDAGLLNRNQTLLLQQPCVRPIKQRYSRIHLGTGEYTESQAEIPCRSSWQTLCPPCAARKVRDTWLVAASGLMPLRMIPNEPPSSTEHVIFVTLTAPSFGKVHRAGSCPCGKKHHENDALTGVPLDWRRYQFKDQATWNALSSRLFSRTIDKIKRYHAGSVEYFGAVEFQKRQAVHFHVLIKSDMPFDLDSLRVLLGSVHVWSGKGHTGQKIVWGSQTDIQPFDATSLEGKNPLTYTLKVVKYLQKDHAFSTDSTQVNKRLGKFIDRLEKIATDLRDSGSLAGLKPLKRTPLGGGAGFTGQRVKKSRNWGPLSYSILLERRRAWRMARVQVSEEVVTEKLGAPMTTELEEVMARRQFPDRIVDANRILAQRLASRRGSPSPVPLPYGEDSGLPQISCVD